MFYYSHTSPLPTQSALWCNSLGLSCSIHVVLWVFFCSLYADAMAFLITFFFLLWALFPRISCECHFWHLRSGKCASPVTFWKCPGTHMHTIANNVITHIMFHTSTTSFFGGTNQSFLQLTEELIYDLFDL